MVLFDNVYVGQRVEVLWNNGIYKGTVQYRGPIATKRGEWVGVALDSPVGDTNGMLFARRYFQCPANHGVFVRSDRLRFIPSNRCLFDRYHRVARTSDVEEFLFETPYPEIKDGPCNPINISQKDIQRVRTSLGDYSSESVWEVPKYYHLRHSVSNHIPAATMLRPGTTQTPFRYLSRPIHVDYWKDEDFERKPSIPKIHMPHSALKEQIHGEGVTDAVRNLAHRVQNTAVAADRLTLVFYEMVWEMVCTESNGKLLNVNFPRDHEQQMPGLTVTFCKGYTTDYN